MDRVKQRRSDQKAGPGENIIPPGGVIAELEKHLLIDGFKLVVDLEKSRGSRMVDAASGRSLIDFYSFFASMPVGFNHPYFNSPAESSPPSAYHSSTASPAKRMA